MQATNVLWSRVLINGWLFFIIYIANFIFLLCINISFKLKLVPMLLLPPDNRFLRQNIQNCQRMAVTAAIPVTRFGGKVLAHSANSIAVSKATLDDEIKFSSSAKKSDQS